MIQRPNISNGSIRIGSSRDVKTRFLVKGIVEITSMGDLNIVISTLNKIKERLEKRVSKKGKNKKK